MKMPMPTLRPYQAEPLKHIIRSVQNREGLTFSVMMSRQAGKNELSAQLEVLLLTLNYATGGNIVKASPTFKPQTINSILRLKERLDQAGFQGHYSSAFGYQIVFGQARALFYSAEPTANVVGATAHILLELDESQDIDHQKYQKDFRPMGATTNVTTVHYGTAWSDDTLLEVTKQSNLELERKDGIRRHFEYDWQEVAQYNPLYAHFVEAERERLGPDHPLFTTQFELHTLSGGGRFLSPQHLAQMTGDHPRQHLPTPGAIYVAGLDLAGEAEEADDAQLRSLKPRRDSTVLTIGEWIPTSTGRTQPHTAQVRIVEHYYRTGVAHPALYAQMVDVLRTWQVKRVVVDATGVGAGMASFLEDALGSTVEQFTFTAQSKSHLAFQLLAAINAGGLKMYAQEHSQEHRQFWFQAQKAKSALRANQTMNFFVDPAEGHDDFLISTALLVEAAGQYRPRSARGR